MASLNELSDFTSNIIAPKGRASKSIMEDIELNRTITKNLFTGNKVLVTSDKGVCDSSDFSHNNLNHLQTLTSPVQTQIDDIKSTITSNITNIINFHSKQLLEKSSNIGIEVSSHLSSITHDIIENGSINKFIVNDTINGDLNVTGRITANNLIVTDSYTQYVTDKYVVDNMIVNDGNETINENDALQSGSALSITQNGLYNILEVYLQDTTISNKLTVSQNGLVGLGTAYPNEMLDIQGQDALGDMQFSGTMNGITSNEFSALLNTRGNLQQQINDLSSGLVGNTSSINSTNQITSNIIANVNNRINQQITISSNNAIHYYENICESKQDEIIFGNGLSVVGDTLQLTANITTAWTNNDDHISYGNVHVYDSKIIIGDNTSVVSDAPLSFGDKTDDMIVWYKFRDDITDSSENNNDLQAYLKADAPADTGIIPKFKETILYNEYPSLEGTPVANITINDNQTVYNINGYELTIPVPEADTQIYNPYELFTGDITNLHGGGPHIAWNNDNFQYWSSDGSYIGNDYIINDYKGAYFKVKMPQPIILSIVKIVWRRWIIGCAPVDYKIYGSNDGVVWDELIHETNTQYQPNNVHLSKKANKSVSYNHFALVVNKIGANSDVLNFIGMRFLVEDTEGTNALDKKSIIFNNDYAVVVPRPLNDPMYYFQPNMTISFWLYKPTLTSYENIVMNRESHYMGILSENLYGGWSIFTENNNILVRITTEDNKNNVPYHWIGSKVIQEATWQYVTIVFEHVTDDPNVKNNIHLYIDGQHFNTLSFNSEYVQFQSDSIDTAPLAFGTVFYGFNGNTAPGGTYTFSSSQNTGIYDFRMYNRTLNFQEINKIYNYVPRTLLYANNQVATVDILDTKQTSLRWGGIYRMLFNDFEPNTILLSDQYGKAKDSDISADSLNLLTDTTSSIHNQINTLSNNHQNMRNNLQSANNTWNTNTSNYISNTVETTIDTISTTRLSSDIVFSTGFIHDGNNVSLDSEMVIPSDSVTSATSTSTNWELHYKYGSNIPPQLMVSAGGSGSGSGGTSYSFGDDTTDMLVWYKLDGDVLDSSGNGNDLNIVNSISEQYDSTLKKIGSSSFNFNSRLFATVPYPTGNITYFTPTTMTISTWIYNAQIHTKHQGIASARYYNSGGYGWTLYIIPTTGELSLWIGEGPSRYWNDARFDYNINQIDTEWTHIAVTLNNKIIKLYINNVFISEITISSTIYYGGGFNLGSASNGDFPLKTGTKLDDFRLYNRALTEQEITDLYNYVPGAGATTIEYVLGNVLKFPPAPLPSNDNDVVATLSDNEYGNGDYKVYWQNMEGNGTHLFDGNLDATVSFVARSYNYGSGNYEGGSSIAGFNGDWVAIKLPTNIVLSYIKIYYSNLIGYKVLGTNNGTDWTVVISQDNISYVSQIYTSSPDDILTPEQFFNEYVFIVNKYPPYSGNYTTLRELEFYGAEAIASAGTGAGGGAATTMVYSYGDVQQFPPAPLPTTERSDPDALSTSATLTGLEYGNGDYFVSYSSRKQFSDHRFPASGVFNNQDLRYYGSWWNYVYDYYGEYEGNSEIAGIKGEWIRLKLPLTIKLSYIEIYCRTSPSRDVILPGKNPAAYKIFGTNDNGVSWTEILSISNVDYINDADNFGIYPQLSFTPPYRKHISPISTIEYGFNEFALLITKIGGQIGVLGFDDLIFYGAEEFAIESTITTPFYTDLQHLLMWYKFDQNNFTKNSGNLGSAYDVAQNSALVDTAIRIKGNGAANLNGSYMIIQSDLDFTANDVISICFWTKMTQLHSQWDVVLYKEMSATNAIKIQRYAATNYWNIQFGAAHATTDGFLNDFSLDDTTWRHYCFTFIKTGSAVTFKIFKNGLEEPVFNQEIANAWPSVAIGKVSIGDPTYPLRHFIDDLRFYDRELSVAEINELYQYEPPVVDYITYKTTPGAVPQKSLKYYPDKLAISYNTTDISQVTIQHNDAIGESTSIPGSGGYKYFAFTSTTGTNSITFDRDTICDVLVVGGGGGSGRSVAGGGGGGGVAYMEGYIFEQNKQFDITVGEGGIGLTSPSDSTNNNGGDSIISSGDVEYFKGIGGGGSVGQSYAYDYGGVPRPGGSGAGGIRRSDIGTTGAISTQNSADLIPGTLLYGNNGGNAYNAGSYGGGGGGGAGTPGGNANSSVAGNGGDGIMISITSEDKYYGGGGGGSGNVVSTIASGGLGGGGDGGGQASAIQPSDGVNGLGGGAGGGITGGKKGGSGIVIIRWYSPENEYDVVFSEDIDTKQDKIRFENGLKYDAVAKELTAGGWKNRKSYISHGHVSLATNSVSLYKGERISTYTSVSPMRQYPDVFLTGANTVSPYTSQNHVVQWSSEEATGNYRGHHLFNGDRADVGWISANDKYYDDSDTIPSGSVAGDAIDTSSYIGDDSENFGEWVKIELDKAIYLSYVKIYERRITGWSFRNPAFYVIYGSNDGNTWTRLIVNKTDEAIYTTDADRVHTSETVTPTNKYKHFAITVTKTKGGLYGDCGFSELEFYGNEHINVKTSVITNSMNPSDLGSVETNNVITKNISPIDTEPIKLGKHIEIHNTTDTITNYDKLMSSNLTDTASDEKTYCMRSQRNIWIDGADIVWTSDERIKKDIQDIDDDGALQKILAIEPKTYKYIDHLERGKNKVYGFISQQVRDVIPEATTQTKKYIPNIYKYCPYFRKTIVLPKDFDISTIVTTYNGKLLSDKLRLISSAGEASDVSFVLNGDASTRYTMTIMGKIPGDGRDVFVYGTEIDDMTTIDKSYIYTLNVCATQTLSRKTDTIDEMSSNLLSRTSELEQRIADIESHMSG